MAVTTVQKYQKHGKPLIPEEPGHDRGHFNLQFSAPTGGMAFDGQAQKQ